MIDVKQFITDYFKLGVQVENFSISEMDGQELEQLLIAFQQRLLQQTPCSTLRDGLQQMLNSEQKNFGEHYFITDEVREKQSNLNAIAHVIKLIDECLPVA